MRGCVWCWFRRKFLRPRGVGYNLICTKHLEALSLDTIQRFIAEHRRH